MILPKILSENLTNICEYNNNGLSIVWEKKLGQYHIYYNNTRWMIWNPKNKKSLFEVYSHYALAYGHCICTGMGFLLREKWILQKPNVTKITVIEINKELIDYHKKFNPDIMSKMEIVNCNVYDYKGKCDTLLIDNFEGSIYQTSDADKFLLSVNLINKNIDSKTTWAWPMESLLDLHYKKYIGMSLVEIYEKIKRYYKLEKFPVLSEEDLFYFCYVYNVAMFEKI